MANNGAILLFMKTYAFIDASNLFYGGEKSLGWKIDYKKLLGYLKEKYDVSATVIKDRTKQKIHIGRADYEAFKVIIRPYVIPSMIYKIASPRNDLSSPFIKELGGA